MLELVLAIGGCVVMGKIAAVEDDSALAWGGITFLICIGSMFVPLPYVRILGAMFVSFVLMIVVRLIRDR